METTEAQKELVPNPKQDMRKKVFCSFSEMVEISAIKEHPKNANRHGREQVEILANAIRATGWRTPVGVSKRSGYIIRGHGRFAAAKALGLTHVPVDFQDYETESQELADLLGDNKIADLSEIDYEGVSNILKAMPDDQLFMTGFRDFEIAPLRAAEWIKPALCDMPEVLFTTKFSTTQEEGETIRKAIKICQSKQAADLTDGACLQMIATWYLAQVIQFEKTSQQIVKADPPQLVDETEQVPLEKFEKTFKIQYVASVMMGDDDGTVIREENDGPRYYTKDPAVVSVANDAKEKGYAVSAQYNQQGFDLWLTSLAKAQESANVQ